MRRLLQDIIHVHYGKALKAEDRDETGIYPVYGSFGKIGNHHKRLIDYPTLIIGRKGSVGAITYASQGGWPIDTAFYIEIIDKSSTDLKYLYYALKQAKLDQYTITTSIPGINRNDIYKTSIPLPPLPEQQRIAAILDKADALREKRRRTIAKLDELLESSFLQLYENKLLLNTMKLEDVAEKSRGSFVNGPFGSDLLTSELTKSGVPVIYIRDIREGEYNRVSESFVSKDKAEKLSVCSVFPRDVLIAKVGDPPGTAALYPDNEPYGIVTQDVIRIRTNNQIVTPEFLVSYFNSSIGCWNLSKIIIEATRARFSLTDLKKLSLEIPSLSQQKQFSSIAKKIFALKLQQKKSLDKLDILFLSLQQRAFSGELFAQQANEELDKVANEEKPGQMSLFDLMG